ncbi:hypothetical protein [Leeuwenhoekiella marinoflava]|uniref:Uncharacterized protein n=2 Tax=Leeuwenhoekiella marinoflava TaxID=988 RepID=A0A4Q0PNL9_9FLAO|nr:hypothetical protein [Leeuwenhoekiella marinoflava]RXG32041.1 hypothetical protein DSL99_1346 [Leeuwenhoekiella marinoflava]SHE95911.1 hypothetical protein SAMN02745246_01401 [Leeuwenhoekiella marinoflava DSM 3653]
MKQIVMKVLALLAISKIPIAEGKTSFSAEQVEDLNKRLGEKDAKRVIAALDKFADDIVKDQEKEGGENAEDAAARAELQKLLDEHELTEDEAKKIAKDGSADPSLKDMISAVNKLVTNQDELIQKLMKEPEPDNPVAKGTIKREDNLEHSATHFLGRNREIDAYTDRPWNQRAAGLIDKPTDWAADGGSAAFEKLKSDMYNHYTEVNDRIKSLHRDMLKLPAYFKLRSNVSDRVADGNIVTAEITQSRKAGWLPKNKQLIQPEEGKVFPVHIDIEWQGIDLQEYETSWLNAWSKPGSSPYKMSFVEFLIVELDKKARVEDRKVAIAGIYSAPAKGKETKAGDAINRGDGLLVHLFRAFHYEKKYKRANIGIPNPQNILDHVKALIESNLPEEVRNQSGIVINTHPDTIRWYALRKRAVHGMETDWTKDGEKTILNYPNIRFEPIYDQPNPLYMFITFDDNVELMENLPKEKSIYRMDTLKRDIFVYADYKWGARFLHIGTKVKAGDPDAFKVQTVWDNGLPMFPDNWTVPVFDDTTGELTIPYSNVKVDSAWATDITDIKNTYAGQIVKIKGNTALAAVKNVTSAGNMTLTGNFNLQSGGTLTLYVNSDLTLTEVSRTTEPEIIPEVVPVNFDGDSINAQESNEFNYTGDSNQTLAAIEGGVDGQEITIKGNATANATLTVSNIAAPAEGESAVSVKSDAALAVAADYITLVRINGVFTEVKRNIEA